MRRTNIYLSETEQAALDAMAAGEGSTRSDVVRGLVDRELNLAEGAELDAALLRAAADIASRAPAQPCRPGHDRAPTQRATGARLVVANLLVRD